MGLTEQELAGMKEVSPEIKICFTGVEDSVFPFLEIKLAATLTIVLGNVHYKQLGFF